ncbi:MAG: DNA gyrase inhibitor YacG [Alphaproteobacteria bacterium]|nr:DNA gyrase inhibitor YacG [Alphaproteobacteria bacterium]
MSDPNHQKSDGKCPNCGKPRSQDFLPFCSRHCANLDLGRWLDGKYAIPTDETPQAFSSEGQADDQD